MDINKPNLKLNIGVLAYNHGPFIEKALKGALAQETNFEFEILVIDDASTDNTYKVLERVAAQHQGKVRTIRHERNQGMFASAMELLSRINAPYVAYLEADDEWTYPQKLQRQVDFLEANEQYRGCFHDATIYTHYGENDPEHYASQSVAHFKTFSQLFRYRPEFMAWDLLQSMHIPGSSIVFKWDESILEKLKAYDQVEMSFGWLMQLMIVDKYRFKYFNEIWSIYNDHPGGITKQRSFVEFNKTKIYILEELLKDEFYGKHLSTFIYEAIAKECQYILNNDSFKKSKKMQRQLFFKMFWAHQKSLFHGMKYFMNKRKKDKK